MKNRKKRKSDETKIEQSNPLRLSKDNKNQREIRERETRASSQVYGFGKSCTRGLCRVKDPIAGALLFRAIFCQIGHAYARTGILM